MVAAPLLPWLLAAPLSALASGAGGDPPRIANAVRTPEAPAIDGRLDEPVWELAPPIGELVQLEPLAGAAPSEASEIRFLYDDEHLYMGVRCFDREPERILVTSSERDALLVDDDRLEIVFDTFHDRRNAFFFQINAGGSKGDALVTSNGANFNKPWDGIWEGRAAIDAHGWTAELALPFKTLNFRPGATTWGFNVMRYIGRKREEARWADPSRDFGLFQIYRAGELRGFDGIRQGIGVDVVPFFVANWRNARDDGQKTLLGEPGFDLFYKLIPSLTLSVTVNTDFAETEVDVRQIDLSRFDLFFPERRDFFLQDAGLFEFGLNNSGGGGDRALIPFFSRRIGLSSAGEEIPILAGAKLTGRAGAYGIGLLDVQTDDEGALDGQNLLAARITRDFGGQSTVGALVTHGDPEGAKENTVYGFDAVHRGSAWNGERELVSTLFLLRSEGEDAPGGRSAFGFALRAPSDQLSWSLGALEIQEGFEAELGFVPRRDVRRYRGSVSFEPRPDWPGVRQLSFGLGSVLFTDTDDELETWETELQAFGVELESGDGVSVLVSATRDELEDGFVVFADADGGGRVTIPAGRYDFLFPRLAFESASKRALALELQLGAGEFFDGDRVASAIGLVWRPSARFTGTLEYVREDIDLPGGEFVTQLANLRANVSFSPALSWGNFVQWSSDRDTLGLQSRLRWIPASHQEVFLVFEQEQESDSSSSAPLFQELSLKLAYALRF